jgi:hypothetical protein|mmetsp:Transcript_14669/g.31606  ORF Transcript_14669/g.31606 Transcript_14669/m.31606 type:complete len:115 (+) Transcript_14669:1144-1488(+)
MTFAEMGKLICVYWYEYDELSKSVFTTLSLKGREFYENADFEARKAEIENVGGGGVGASRTMSMLTAASSSSFPSASPIPQPPDFVLSSCLNSLSSLCSTTFFTTMLYQLLSVL